MSITILLGLILVGIIAGLVSGMIGIGGGIVIVPILVFLFGYNQHLAQGTTLALMVPPIGVLAAWEYYKNGYVDLKIAALICIGFIIGSYFGAKISVHINEDILRKIFSVILVLIGIKMFFFKT